MTTQQYRLWFGAPLLASFIFSAGVLGCESASSTGQSGSGGATSGQDAGPGSGGSTAGSGGAGSGGATTGGASGAGGVTTGGTGTGGTTMGGNGGAHMGGSGGQGTGGANMGGATGFGGAGGAGAVTYSACMYLGAIDRFVVAKRDPQKDLCVVLVLDSPGANPFNLTLPQNWGMEFAFKTPIAANCLSRFPGSGATAATGGSGTVVMLPTPQPTANVDVSLTFPGGNERLMVTGVLAPPGCQ